VKVPFGKSRYELEDNIKLDLKKDVRSENVDRIRGGTSDGSL